MKARILLLIEIDLDPESPKQYTTERPSEPPRELPSLWDDLRQDLLDDYD